MLGIQYPITQGAFHGFGTSPLASAVSEAGGLGMITAHALNTPQGLREDIHRLKSKTDKPFGVNITISLCQDIDRMIDVIIDEQVPVVETSAYRAEKYGKRLQAASVKWIHKVATVKHALSAEAQGADAVVIIGLEGTGFKNPIQLPTLIAIPWAVRQIKIPVIAGGGIGDSHGFMAALSMGAEAVYMGTAFMATKECPISDHYKQILVKGNPTDPKFRDRNLASPKNEEYNRVMEKKGTMPDEQWLLELEKAMAKATSEFPQNEMEMIMQFAPGSLAIAVTDKIVTVKELIESIITGAEAIRQRWAMG